MKETQKFLAVLLIAVLIGLATIAYDWHASLKYQRKTDELQGWFEEAGYQVALGAAPFTENITDYSYSFFLWFLFIEDKPATLIVRSHCTFYYHWQTNETDSWHAFDVKAYMHDPHESLASFFRIGIVVGCLVIAFVAAYCYVREITENERQTRRGATRT